MTISSGYRIHEGKYRMPDLLTEAEMKMYFASTYSVGVDLRELTDEEREQIDSVGTIPMTPVVGDRERETALLREQLGITELEKRVEAVAPSTPPENPAAKLDSLIK